VSRSPSRPAEPWSTRLFSQIRPPAAANGTNERPASHVQTLAPELLGHIFFLCRTGAAAAAAPRPQPPARTRLEDSTLAWVTLTHVCARWRAVALDWAALWTDVCFDLGPAWAETMLARARGAPLTIALTLPLPPAYVARPQTWLADTLDAHSAHLRVLTLGGCPAALHALLARLDAPAPTLARLALHPTHYLFGELPLRVPPKLFARVTPRLHALSLRCAALPAHSALLHNLRALRVVFPAPLGPGPGAGGAQGPFASVGALLDALDDMPELESLNLVHCLPPAHADNGARARAEKACPRLKNVTLAGAPEDKRPMTARIELEA
jgi:hypothetical protein